jgi:nitrite reductase (NO-forming)
MKKTTQNNGRLPAIQRMMFLALVILAVTACSTQNPTTADTAPPSPQENTPVTTSLPDTATSAVQTVQVDGRNFKFVIDGKDNPDIIIKEGTMVKMVFTNTEGFHDFVIDELGAKTQQLNAGESATIAFIADKKGTFEYYCSVGKHRQMGMKGKFIVE